MGTQTLGLEDTMIGQWRVARACAEIVLVMHLKEEFPRAIGNSLEASYVVDRLAVAHHQEPERHLNDLKK